MDAYDLRRARWRISTHSANGSTCVQVARNLSGIVAVRDSKDPAGPALVFTPAEWRAFTSLIKHGRSGSAPERQCSRLSGLATVAT